MSNFRNFNRHECFNHRIADKFSTVKRDIRDWAVCDDVEIPTLENQLFGLWDGYLYDGLIERCESLGVPKFLIYRLEDVVNHVEKYLENNGEIKENEVHSINLR